MKNTGSKIICILLISYLPQLLTAQIIQNRDKVISQAVNDISVSNLKTIINDLVGFHNRNNLSSQTDPHQGIGAAANYLYDKASSYIPSSNGRLQVENISTLLTQPEPGFRGRLLYAIS
ncbi:MAG: hypothetical protein LIP01_10850 [Tannerellaceae bacterium]|nr:hypothetical protein [Tannerellaceae bacterium]